MPVCVQIIHFIHTTVRTCTCFSPEPRREELLHHLSTTDTVFPTAVAKSVVLATGPGVPLWHFPGQRTDSFFTRRFLVFLCWALPFRSRMPSYTHRGSTHSITVLPGEEKCCNLFENLAFLSVSLKIKWKFCSGVRKIRSFIVIRIRNCKIQYVWMHLIDFKHYLKHTFINTNRMIPLGGLDSIQTSSCQQCTINMAFLPSKRATTNDVIFYQKRARLYETSRIIMNDLK